MTTFNQLSPAEVERLYYLSEELAESIQAIQKVLRHGYESKNPTKPDGLTNREHLSEELGQALLAIELLCLGDDLDMYDMQLSATSKSKELGQWMHHQPEEILNMLKED